MFNTLWPEIISRDINTKRFDKNDGTLHTEEQTDPIFNSLEKGYDLNPAIAHLDCIFPVF